ncbi:MAG: sulfate permease, SulP family [Actinomycetota bacterium]|nr:sulfate permease, SulP family [Actinomycetota bacterium]
MSVDTVPRTRPGLLTRLGLMRGLLPYDRRWLAPDLIAGATLAAVAIPEGLGYAKIAGMPPETGLYTCLLPVLLFALFASSRRLVVGADSATAAISAGAVGILAANDPSTFFALTGMLAIITGVLLLGAGAFRLGVLSNFMSRSVLAGFLTGVGIQIAIGQLHGMLGVESTGRTTAEKLTSTLGNVPKTSIPDLIVAVTVVATILLLGKFAPRLPGPLIAVIGSMVAARVLHLKTDFDVAMVGALPSGLPPVTVPSASWADIVALAPTAIVLMLVIIAQSVSTASAFAIAHDDLHDPNRDLIGLGGANLAAGFGSTFAVNGSPTKTAISDKAGTRSQMAMLVLAGITALVLLFLTGVFDYLPEAALAAVVFVIAIHLLKIATLRMLFTLPRRGEFWIATSTAVVVAFVGVGAGILWAIVWSIVVHLANTSRPHNTVLELDQQGERIDNPVVVGAQTEPGLIVYRFSANLYFANAGRLVSDVSALLSEPPTPLRNFVLDASEIEAVDWTSAENLRKAIELVQESGATFAIARLPNETRATLDFFGITDLIGAKNYFDTVRHAIKHFEGES